MKPWTWSCPSSPGKLNSTAAAGRDATSARADIARTKRIPATRSFQPEKTAVYLNSVSTRRCPSASFPMSTERRSYGAQWKAWRREVCWTGGLWAFPLHARCPLIGTEAKTLAEDCQGAEPLPERRLMRGCRLHCKILDAFKRMAGTAHLGPASAESPA